MMRRNFKEEMVLALIQQKNIFALQGDALYEKYGFLVIQHGSDVHL